MFRYHELNAESLLPGPNNFTLERIESQLRHDLWTDPHSPEAGVPGPFMCEGFGYSREGERHRFFTDLEQNERRERFCRDLYEQTTLDPASLCSRLDDRLSRLVSCDFRVEAMNDISDHAYHFLTRLPARPLQLPDVPVTLCPDYLVHGYAGDSHSTTTVTLWDNLQVTSYVSASVICAALLSEIAPGSHGLLQDFLNTVADLIGTASKLFSSADSEPSK